MGDRLPFFVMFTTSEVLRTSRLLLRPFERQDADRLCLLTNNWDVASMTAGMPFPYKRDDAVAFLAMVPSSSVGAIVRVRELVGSCGLNLCRAGVFEIVYFVGKAHWAQSIASEAAAAVVARAFADFRTGKITAGYFEDNPASGRVQEKLGFQAVGWDTTYSLARKRRVATRSTELTRERWQARTFA